MKIYIISIKDGAPIAALTNYTLVQQSEHLAGDTRGMDNQFQRKGVSTWENDRIRIDCLPVTKSNYKKS